MVIGFLIVIFYRNQLQRSSSKETLCAREVHRMVLGGLNVQILHQKMLYTSYMFWWKEEKLLNILYAWFQLQVTFLRVRSLSNKGPFAPHPMTLTSKLQRHWTCLQKNRSIFCLKNQSCDRRYVLPPPHNQIYSRNWYHMLFLCWNSQSFTAL